MIRPAEDDDDDEPWPDLSAEPQARPRAGSAGTPSPRRPAPPQARSGDEAYALDERAAALPKRPIPPTPAPAVPTRLDSVEHDGRSGLKLLEPMVLVGGAIGVVALFLLGGIAAVVLFRSGGNANRPTVAAESAPKEPAEAPTAAPGAADPASQAVQAALAPASGAGVAETNTSSPPVQPQPAGGTISVADALVFLGETNPGVTPARAAGGGTSLARTRPSGGATAPEPAVESNVAAQARAAAATVGSRDIGAGKTLSTADIVAESEPSVALIKGKGSSGTGFLVAPGLLATNSHVIDDEFIADLEVRFVSADESRKTPLNAELLYEDPERDLAFLAVKTDLKPLRVARTYTFRKGEDITVIGNPGFGDGQVLENAISRGVMSTKTQIDNRNFYQLGIAINPGNSGGPVFDSSGRVIGVATLKAAKQEATGFCIPIEDVQLALATLAKDSSREADAYRSRHRIKTAVKGLGGSGALICLIIDLRRVAPGSNSAGAKEALDRLESVAAELEKDVFPSLALHAPRIKNDPLVAQSVRSKVGEMAQNFTRLRSAYTSRRDVDNNTLLSWKQTHKRLIMELSAALKLDVPAGMMVAFEDHAPSQQDSIITMGPPGLGLYHRRLIPRPRVTPPVTPRSRLRERMRPGIR